jgi:hypothetical protein
MTRAFTFPSLSLWMAAAAIPLNTLAQPCGFQRAFLQPDEKGTATVQVYRAAPVAALGNQRPLVFITSLKVNTDGTKVSYHQDDPTGRRCLNDAGARPCAINNIRNAFLRPSRPVSDFEAVRDAGYPAERTWQVLSDQIIEKSKRTGKPCLTGDGYLVSMTADVAVPGGFARQGDCDPTKWIDALTIPALVIPGGSPFAGFGVAKRSLVVALSASTTQRVVPGVVGDFGPSNEIGEASVAMNRSLNGLDATDLPRHRVDAIERFQAGRTAVLVFPGPSSVLARPITPERVSDAGSDALARFGGADRVYRCIRSEIDSAF